MNKHKYLQGGLIIALLVLLVWQLIPSDKQTEEKLQALVPDWFGVEVAVTEMNEQGKPKRSFSAQRLTHYAEQNMTDLIDPHFTLYPEDKIPWHLAAEKGRSFHGKHTTDIERLDLWHDVTVWQPEEATPTPMRMHTSTMAIFPEQAFAETDQFVEFEQPGHTLTGEGLRARFNDQSMELFNNVRSEHVPQNVS